MVKSFTFLVCATVIAGCLAGCGTARVGLVTRASEQAAVLTRPAARQAPAAAGLPGNESLVPAAPRSAPPPGDTARADVGLAELSLAGGADAGLADTPQREAAEPDAPVGELAQAALLHHPDLAITEQDGLEIAPLAGASRWGVVFYPGGDVDPRTYAPLARAWALAGYTVCIPAMPQRKAIFAPNRATAVMARHPAIKGWVVGGHLLGGVAASMYASWHPRRVGGLMLLAAVPGPLVNLSHRALPALSVYGTLDPRVPLVEISTTAGRLPPASRLVGITGGNHGQFGDYGPHPRDAAAAISRAEQHRRIIAATLDWLDALQEP